MTTFCRVRRLVAHSSIGAAVFGVSAFLAVLIVSGTVSSTRTLLSRLVAQTDPVSQCFAGCDSMQGTEEQKSQCRSGCSSMTTGGTTGGSGCEFQPNWPDCAVIECQNNNWTCTQMRENSTQTTTTTTTSTMRSCFYPNATINGTPPGYTVWCEGDYVNCHQGEPSGAPVSLSGLSLGAPSWCEGGTTGGTTGGTSGTSGTTGTSGTSGTTGDTPGTTGTTQGKTPYQMCLEGCGSDTACVQRWCDPMNPAAGQASSAGGQTGGTPSSGYTGGPVNCTYPNGVTLYCESPHVRCRRSQSDPTYLTDQQVGANGGTADCRPATGGGGATQPTTTTTTTSTMRNCFYPNATINGTPPGYTVWCEGDYVNCHQGEPSGAPVSLSGLSLGAPSWCENGGGWNGGTTGGGMDMDIAGMRRDAERNLNDYERQLWDMDRAAKESRANVGSAVSDFKTAVAKARSCVQSATTGDAIRACVDFDALGALSQKVWDAIQTAGMSRQFKEIEQQQLPSMEEFVKRMKSAGQDVSQLETLLTSVKSIFANAKGTTARDSQEIMQKFYDAQMQFWKLAESYRGAEERANMGRGLADNCRRIQEEGGRQGQAVAAQLDGLVRRCMETVSKLTAGGQMDPWVVKQTMEGIWKEFETIMQSSWSNQACREAEFGLGEARRGINEEAPKMIQKVKAQSPQAAAKLEGVLQKGKAILARVEQALKQNQCDKVIEIMSSEMENLRYEFEGIMRDMGGFGGGFEEGIDFAGDKDRHYADLYERMYGEEELYGAAEEDSGGNFEVFSARMKDRGYRTEDLVLLKQIDPKLIRAYIGFDAGDEGNDVVRAAATADMSATSVEELLATKNTLLRDIEELRQTQKSLKAGVQEALRQIQAYTFNPALADDVGMLIAAAPTMNAQDLAAQVNALRDQSRELNVREGIAPFKDVDPFEKGHDWFVKAVKREAEKGVFKGVEEGRFAPEKEANRAEVLMVFARMGDLDTESAESDSALARGMPAWARGAAAAVDEELSFEDASLDQVFTDSDPAKPATRMEVARLVAGLFADDLPEADGDFLRGYDDLGAIGAQDRKAVSRLIAAGVMTGNAGEWNPQGTFNRAQFATVVDRLTDATSEEEDGEEDEETESAPAASRRETEEEEAAEEETERTSENSGKQEEVDIGFDLTKVKRSEFTVIQAILSSWNASHKADPKGPMGRKIARTLESVQSLYESANDPLHAVNLENQMLSEQADFLREILEENARAMTR